MKYVDILTTAADTKDNIVTFASGDEANPSVWKDVTTLASKEKHLSLLNKISTMFSNVRYLYKILGTTDISALGTVTQAIATLNGNVGSIKGISSSAAITTQGQYALDAREKNASIDGTLANELSKVNSNLENGLATKAGIDQISNPNLIENPFFNVNSRGKSEYTIKNEYCVDRWFLNEGTGNKLIPNDDGVSLQTTTTELFKSIIQHTNKIVSAKEYTLSVKYKSNISGNAYMICYDGSNSEISRVQLALPSTKDEWSMKNVTFVTPSENILKTRISISYHAGNIDTTYMQFRAIKLELGEVSTLHMDSAPDVELERMRCMLSTSDPNDTYANKTLQQSTGDEWDSTYPYVAGDYCIHANQLWLCKVDNSGQTPSEGTYWTATSVSSVLKSLDDRLQLLES